MSSIAILGAGSRGTALAQVFADTKNQVTLQSLSEIDVHAINTQHKNPQYFGDYSLSPSIVATTDITSALQEAERVVIALPSRVLPEVFQNIAPELKDKKLLLATKGFCSQQQLFFSDMITKKIGTNHLVVLSGPSHAEEVILRKRTKVALASQDEHLLIQAASLFPKEYFLLELTDDVQGLQIGGAIKNIIALAAGISDGLGNGINAKTALLAQGIKEMKQFASLYGGKAETMEGVAGLGDLLVTAMSPLSRNRQAGNYLAQGYNKEQIIHELMHMEVESFTVLKKIDLPPDAHQNFPIFSMVKYLYTNNPSRGELISLFSACLE